VSLFTRGSGVSLFICAARCWRRIRRADSATLCVAARPKDLWAGRGYAAADSAVWTSWRNRNGGKAQLTIFSGAKMLTLCIRLAILPKRTLYTFVFELVQPLRDPPIDICRSLCQTSTMVERYVKLFKNGRNQAVRIPREFELPGQNAIIRKEGPRLIIEPVPPRSLLAVLKTLVPLDEQFPPIQDPPAEPLDL
jgi:antitoxin VapB